MARKFSVEYKNLIVVAAPLVFIQLCQASLGLVDTLLAGQYHFVDLAAVGLGSAVWTSIFIFLAGTLYVIVPKFAELEKSRDPRPRKELYVIAARVALFLSIFGFLTANFAALSVGYFISDKEVAALSRTYLHCISFAFPPLVFISMLRYVGEGHQKLTILAAISAMLLVLNFLLSYWFVNGGLGIPALGGIGCGVGTALSAYITLFVLHLIIKKTLPDVFVTKQEKIDIKSPMIKVNALIKEGLPIGIALVLQILALASIAFAAEGLGVKHIGAHQIMISVAMSLVMIPLALGNASTILLAGHVSTQNEVAVRYVIYGAFLTWVVYFVLILAVVLSSYPFIIELFTADGEVFRLAMSGLYAFILFLLFDSLQMMLAGILRGVQDFVSPLIATLIAYWVVILPGLFLLSRGWSLSVYSIATIWQVMSFGLFIAVVFLSYALLFKNKKTLNIIDK